MINSETIIIDVWFTIINWKIMWDADFENINVAWIRITPVPYWVWPLTVAMLMKNTLEAHKKMNKL
jgi:5,10-methylene-tetrahydrofolate dehydrogenase/methenyl tetrahydrofolate cyclohydrolase